MREALMDALPSHPILVEAGAYDGEDTVWFARRCHRVHAFEPGPAYQALRRRTASYANVDVWPLALGAKVQEATLFVSGGAHSQSSSLYQPTGHKKAFPEVTFTTTKPVSVTTIAQLDLHPDGLWLDAQGAELEILKGAGSRLDRVTALVLELSKVHLYDGAPLWPTVRRWLNRHGFHISKRIDNGVQGDVLAVR